MIYILTTQVITIMLETLLENQNSFIVLKYKWFDEV